MSSSTPTDPITTALRKARPLKQKQFNIMMSLDEYQKLLRLSTVMETTMAGAVRAALDRTYAMTIDKIPTCAHGMACPYPHIHQQIPLAGSAAAAPAPAPPADDAA